MAKSKTVEEKTSVHPEKKIGPFASGVGVAIWLNTTETDDGPRSFRSNVAKLVMWRRFPID